MSKVNVGLVQMSCVADKEANFEKAIRKVREAAAKGAQIICLQELFISLYFCDVEDYDNFKLAEPVPGPSTDALSAVAAELNVVSLLLCLKKEHRAFITTQRRYWMRMALILANTVRCTFLMTLLTTKNSTSRRAILAIKYSIQNMRRLECSSAGSVVSRSGAHYFFNGR